MSSGITDYGLTAWLSALLKITGTIDNYWIALASSQPGSASDGTILIDLEPVGGGYDRQEYGTGPTHWGINGNNVVNLDDISFGSPTADWGYINHFALCDQDVSGGDGGNVYAFGELKNPQFIQLGHEFILPAGGLVLAMAIQEPSITV